MEISSYFHRQFPFTAQYMEKLEHLTLKAWIVAGILSIAQIVISDAFFWMWIILCIAMLVDWLAGRFAIQATNPALFSRQKSREGLYGKALGLVVLALLRSMEGVMPTLLPGSVPTTRGIFASLIGVALFIDELDSIDRHRQTLGKPPIPMLSWAIGSLRRITGAEARKTHPPKEGSNP